jgi:hypothetical protein
MRLIVVSAFVLAGCASSPTYAPGPVTTWGQPGRAPSTVPPSEIAGQPDGAPSPSAAWSNSPAPATERPGAGVAHWFKSGRGWTWGAASRWPVRDAGLDGLMVDTLTSPTPGYGREPLANAGAPVNDSWVYPSAAASRTSPQSSAALADDDVDGAAPESNARGEQSATVALPRNRRYQRWGTTLDTAPDESNGWRSGNR